MRFGTGTPFGKNAYPVHLFSGHAFTLPPGNFLVDLGRVSVLQSFDFHNYVWRNMRGPSTQKVQVNSDGTNYRIINQSGVVTGALITTAGSGGTNGIGATQTSCSISFGSAPSNGRAATGYVIVGGSINTSVTVTAAGTGYLVPPLLVIDPPPQGGIQATAYAVPSGTTIGSVVVTNAGAGYTSVPAITVVPQWGGFTGANSVDPAGNTIATAPALYSSTLSSPYTLPASVESIEGAVCGAGTGAVLTINSTLGGSGTLTGIVITDYGANYTGTSIPTITFTGGPTSAAATAIMSFSVTSATTGTAGNPTSVAPNWQSSGGFVAASDGNHNVYNIVPAYGITGLTGTTVTSTIVENPGFGLQKVPTIGYYPTGGTILTTNPTSTAVCGGITDTCNIQRADS